MSEAEEAELMKKGQNVKGNRMYFPLEKVPDIHIGIRQT